MVPSDPSSAVVDEFDVQNPVGSVSSVVVDDLDAQRPDDTLTLESFDNTESFDDTESIEAEVEVPPLERQQVRPRGQRHTIGRRLLRGIPLFPFVFPATVLFTVAVLLFGQLQRPVPLPVLSLRSTSSISVPASPPILPWPQGGQAAVLVSGTGTALTNSSQSPVAIASLTKIMTAYLVLKDKPLAPDAQGPLVTINADEENETFIDNNVNATNVPVVTGEVLSERQLLDGLMVHSANDLADVLARWDAGSVPAFIDKMNATAQALGLQNTQYADTNGLSNGSVSTASDQARLAAIAMANPTFAAVVDQQKITLPAPVFPRNVKPGTTPRLLMMSTATLTNYVSSIGTDGIIGVKSGYTAVAQGCIVLAGMRPIAAGGEALVVSAVTGQSGPGPLQVAQRDAVALMDAVGPYVQRVHSVVAGSKVGSIKVPWSSRRIPVVAGSDVDVLVYSGQTVHVSVEPLRLTNNVAKGATVAQMEVSDGYQRFEVPLRTTAGIKAPSFSWRLLHG